MITMQSVLQAKFIVSIYCFFFPNQEDPKCIRLHPYNLFEQFKAQQIRGREAQFA